ncbi:DUF2325 domain-containing protein [Aureimonas leprariae]|uniref:DUF2325 domain-containing protein n=1 Tax=Plantimonas leprariae TaxID=2615207 RepID=UPI001386D527|nr:DUF2325 domain-containing protein [Aureimonas leprariae]
MRQLLAKLGNADAKTATAHPVHYRGVTAAGRNDVAGKLLNKLLDRKHATAIKRFGRARSQAEVAALWREAMDGGDIPGGYWATISHPLTGEELVREAFSDVHMLSHLVGSASRLDIARLRQLESQLGERDETIARQQARLRRAAAELAERAERIAGLEAGRATLPHTATTTREPDASDALMRKLQLAEERVADALAHLRDREDRLRGSEERCGELERENEALRGEIAACERLAAPHIDDVAPVDLGGSRVLYVGGRPGHVDRLRDLTERSGGNFFTHDGGVEASAKLLPGLIAQADVVLFPVDCVSHAAAERVKRHCREADKPFVPLRSASVATFAAALQHLAT